MKFSIITASLNNCNTLSCAMKSLQEQTHKDFEWLVIDGGSTDGTVEWLLNLDEPRLRWISEKDAGLYDALNKGIRMADGDVVGFLHADDLLAHVDVLNCLNQDFENTGCTGVYGDLQYVRSEDVHLILRHWYGRDFSMRGLRWGWMPAHPTLFVRRQVYQENGLFDLNFNIAADYDFLLRVMKRPEYKWHYHPGLITLMRWGGASSKWSNWLKKKCEDLRVIKKHQLRFPMLVLFFKNVMKVRQLRYIRG